MTPKEIINLFISHRQKNINNMTETKLYIALDDNGAPTVVTEDGKEVHGIQALKFSSLEEVNNWGRAPTTVELTVLVHPRKKAS